MLQKKIRINLIQLKEILKNKSIRKKLNLNLGFFRNISEKKFYNLLNDFCIKKNSELLIKENEKNKINFENLDENINHHFSLFIYFLLGINYIEKTNLNLSEEELFSLIPNFIKYNESEKKENKFKKGSSKKMKLKRAKKAKKGNNIIRINLEDIFNQDIKSENYLTLKEDK